MRNIHPTKMDNEDEVQNSIHSSSIHSVSNAQNEFTPPIRSTSSIDLSEMLAQQIHSVRRRYSHDCYDPINTLDSFDSTSIIDQVHKYPQTSLIRAAKDKYQRTSDSDGKAVFDVNLNSEVAKIEWRTQSPDSSSSYPNGSLKFIQQMCVSADNDSCETSSLVESVVFPLLCSFLNELLFTGSMPNYQRFLRQKSFPTERIERTERAEYRLCFQILFLCDIVLRGIAQVFLCNHPVSGAFICLGLLLSSYVLLGYAILGTTFGTLGAYIVGGVSIDAIMNGLCGYNGALVGSACYVFLGDRSNALLFLIAAVLSFISGYVHICCENVLKVFQLPAFTLAFNLTMMCFLLSIATNNVSKFSFAETVPLQYPADYDKMSPLFLLDACTRGVDTTAGSILVIAGISFASRIAATAAVTGAFVACIISYYVLSVPDVISVRHGLFGYNAAGTCAAISGAVFFRADFRNFAVGCVGAATSVLLLAAFKSIFGYIWHLPILTFPFIFTAWIMMMTRSGYQKPIQAGDSVQVDLVSMNGKFSILSASTRFSRIWNFGVSERIPCNGSVDEESRTNFTDNDARLDEKMHGDDSDKYR